MKIVAVSAYEYRVDYAHGTYAMSGGRIATGHPSLVLRLHVDDGLDGLAASSRPDNFLVAASFSDWTTPPIVDR